MSIRSNTSWPPEINKEKQIILSQILSSFIALPPTPPPTKKDNAYNSLSSAFFLFFVRGGGGRGGKGKGGKVGEGVSGVMGMGKDEGISRYNCDRRVPITK